MSHRAISFPFLFEGTCQAFGLTWFGSSKKVLRFIKGTQNAIMEMKAWKGMPVHEIEAVADASWSSATGGRATTGCTV